MPRWTAPAAFLARRKKQGRIRLPYFHGGRILSRRVVLTFDDGPHPEYTPRILDILRREQVPAVFFLVGAHARAYPHLVRRIVQEGHEIGNHSYHHYGFAYLHPHEVREELERNEQLFRELVGTGTRWVRAPGCTYTAEAIREIRRLGLVRVDTTANSGDWQSPGVGAILRRTLHRLHRGDVILCHDRVGQMVAALPRLIAAVRERGLEFVPLTDLALEAQAGARFAGDPWPPDEGVRLVASRAGTTSSFLARARVGSGARGRSGAGASRRLARGSPPAREPVPPSDPDRPAGSVAGTAVPPPRQPGSLAAARPKTGSTGGAVAGRMGAVRENTPGAGALTPVPAAGGAGEAVE